MHRARAGRDRERRAVRGDHRRRQRQHRRLAAHRRGAGRPGRRRGEEGLRQRSHRRHRCGAGALRRHGRRRRQLRLRSHRAADRAAARGLRPRGRQPLPGRHRAGRDALVASVDRQPGPDVHQPRLLPRAGRRHALRPARLPQGRLREDAVARHGHGVRERDGDQGLAEGNANHRGAGRAPSRRPLAPAAPAHLARRLAPPAVHAPVQPALALSVPGHRAVRGRRSALRAARSRVRSTWRACVSTSTRCWWRASCALLGYQLVLFAVFTKIFAIRAGFHPPHPVAARTCSVT